MNEPHQHQIHEPQDHQQVQESLDEPGTSGYQSPAASGPKRVQAACNAVEEALYSVLEAFWATHLCALAPNHQVRLRIPQIEVEILAPTQGPFVTPVGALINLDVSVNVPSPADAQVEDNGVDDVPFDAPEQEE